MRNSHSKHLLFNPAHVALAVLMLTGCGATVPTGGEAMPGMQLQGFGNQVAFNWSADSLLARQMRRGSVIDLVAEYPTEAGIVSGEQLATSRVNTAQGASGLTFALPASLRNAPTGPVCLRLRENGRAAIPIRAAGGSGSTDGFRYVGWEQQVSLESRRSVFATQLNALLATGKSDSEASANFQKWKNGLELRDVNSCAGLAFTTKPQKPANVIDPSLDTEASRRDCVYRYKAAKYTPAQADQILATFNADLRQAQQGGASAGEVSRLKDKSERAKIMQAAVRQYDASTASGQYTPLFVGWPLALTSSATAESEQNKDKDRVSPVVAAALVDSFSSCERDTKDQLKMARETWTREQDPRLAGGRIEALKTECRARFADEARRAERISTRDARMSKLKADLDALPATGARPAQTSSDLAQQQCVAS